MNKTVVFDFDGVIHKYRQGWNGGEIYDEPNMNVIETIRQLLDNGYCVAIFSTRTSNQICEWWDRQNFNIPIQDVYSGNGFWNKTGIVGVFNKKPAGIVYVDDRALKFDSNQNNLYESITKYVTNQDRYKYYNSISEFMLLGMLRQKNIKFKEVNDKFDALYKSDDNNLKHNIVISMMLLDEWIESVEKYL